MERTSSGFARWVGVANLLNLLLFQALFVVAAMLRPGYSPISQPASDLGIGPLGERVDSGVIVLATLKIALALWHSGPGTLVPQLSLPRTKQAGITASIINVSRGITSELTR
jgi:hypothetical protein